VTTRLSIDLEQWVKRHGGVWETTAPASPESNPSERVHGDLYKRLTALVEDNGLPISTWPYLVDYAVHVYNNTPHSRLEGSLTPAEARMQQLCGGVKTGKGVQFSGDLGDE